MSSLYDELMQKIQQDPRLTKRSLPRFDLSLLLFNAGDDLRELWLAAEQELAAAQQAGRPPAARLAAAVEKLHPVFGERAR